jgi:hypothetical protein
MNYVPFSKKMMLLVLGRPALGCIWTLLLAVPYKQVESSNPALSSTMLVYPHYFLVQTRARGAMLCPVPTTPHSSHHAPYCYNMGNQQSATYNIQLYKGDDTYLIERQNHRLLQPNFIAAR